jgi:hypothetical protein
MASFPSAVDSRLFDIDADIGRLVFTTGAKPARVSQSQHAATDDDIFG